MLLAAAVAILYSNGIDDVPVAFDLRDITLAVASGQLSKDELRDWLRTRLFRGGPRVCPSRTNESLKPVFR
jgi:hypothetical protein